MNVFTRYGSQVQIIQAYKEQRELGAFLVQAQVIQESPDGVAMGEKQSRVIGENNPFNRGWISSNELVAEGGTPNLVQAIMQAPMGTPGNCESLLKLYYPATFGRLELVGNVAHGVQPIRASGAIRVA